MLTHATERTQPSVVGALSRVRPAAHSLGMETFTLVSHPGSRAYTGFGPREFPFLEESDFTRVATIGDALYVVFEGELLQGFLINETLEDADLVGDLAPGMTVAFDGSLPLQDGGCSETRLWFSATHVFRQMWGQLVPIILTRKVDSLGAWGRTWPDQAQLTQLDGPSVGWVEAIASPVKANRSGLDVNLCGAWTRIAYTIFETDQIPSDVDTSKVVVAIHDDGAARRWFDPSVALDTKIGQSEKHLQALIDQLIAETAKAQARLDRTDAPTRVCVNPCYTDKRAVDVSVVDRLYVLRWLRDLFGQPVGETFDPTVA